MHLLPNYQDVLYGENVNVQLLIEKMDQLYETVRAGLR